MHDGTLSGKYLVERADGQSRPSSRYFVLNYAADPYARTAMLRYADACQETHPALAAGIRDVVAYHESRESTRRRDPSKPVRGAQGSGGQVADSDALVELLRRRLSEDAALAAMIAGVLASHPAGTEPSTETGDETGVAASATDTSA
jgi:hypothetical protein